MPTNRQTSTQNHNEGQAHDVIQLIGEIVFLLIQIVYLNLEALFRIFLPPIEKSVKGEVVLVTGAGHGIGKEIALQYAALGATVIAWDINAKNNLDTVKQISKLGYTKAYDYVCDVTDREMVFKTVEKVKKDVGNITIIVNNAGIMPTHSLLEQTQDEIERTFKINVFGHFWIIQAILPSMLKYNHGHIVSISSCAGVVGIENLVPYSGTKFAVRGYMEALEHELRLTKPNCQIKLTTICPYMVDTGLCKRPKIRFASAMNILPPEYVAQQAIAAQRRDLAIISIPGYFLYCNNIFRIFSRQASIKIKDFIGATLDSDL